TRLLRMAVHAAQGNIDLTTALLDLARRLDVGRRLHTGQLYRGHDHQHEGSINKDQAGTSGNGDGLGHDFASLRRNPRMNSFWAWSGRCTSRRSAIQKWVAKTRCPSVISVPPTERAIRYGMVTSTEAWNVADGSVNSSPCSQPPMVNGQK